MGKFKQLQICDTLSSLGFFKIPLKARITTLYCVAEFPHRMGRVNEGDGCKIVTLYVKVTQREF